MSTVDDAAEPASDDRPPAERTRRLRSRHERDVPDSARRRPPVPVVAALLVTLAVVVATALGLPVLRGRAAAEALAPASRQVAQAAPLPPPSPTPTPTPAPEASPVETPSGTDPAEVTFEVYSVRDPFAQLVTPPGADGGEGGDGGDGGTSPGPGTDGAGATPGAQPTPDPGTITLPGTTPEPGTTPQPGTTPEPGASPTAGPSELGATTVELVDTFVEDGADKALVSVNGRGYEVAEGQAFATDFTLVAVDAPCVTLTYETRQFLLCEGDEILK